MNRLSGVIKSHKQVIKAVFALQDAIDAFGQGVVIAVANFAHAGTDAKSLKAFTIGPGGVLNAVVRVMDQSLKRTTGRLANGLLQGSLTSFNGQ